MFATISSKKLCRRVLDAIGPRLLLGTTTVRHAKSERKRPKQPDCGEGGIRTLDTLARILVFETSAFNHSATSPNNFRNVVA